MKPKKVLVIVAHPDDETIWMGGTLIRNSILCKKWDLTIISLCRKNDKDRAPKFFRVCKILNAKGFMSDLEDDKLGEIDNNEVVNRIKEIIDKNDTPHPKGRGFSDVKINDFEHPENLKKIFAAGEISLGKGTKLCPPKSIKISEISKKIKNGKDYDYVFTHGENGEYGHIRHKDVNRAVKKMIGEKIISCKKLFLFAYVRKDGECYIDPTATKFINLNKQELLKKKELMTMTYGFDRGSFEEISCKDKEAFKLA